MDAEETVTQSPVEQSSGEYALYLAIGGIAGALLGVAVAHAVAQRKSAKIGAKEGIKLAMVLVGAARQIAAMVGE